MRRIKVYTRNAEELPDVITISELAFFLSWSEITLKRKIKSDSFTIKSQLVKNENGGMPIRIFHKADVLKVYSTQQV